MGYDDYVTLCLHCGDGWDGPGRCSCPTMRGVSLDENGRRHSGPWSCFLDGRQVNSPTSIGLGPWRGSKLFAWFYDHPEVW